MPYNQIVGLVLLAFGLIVMAVCVVAFWKVLFNKKPKKGTEKILEQVNALIQNWTNLLKLLPENLRSIFVLLPFGFILAVAGLYILIKKPI